MRALRQDMAPLLFAVALGTPLFAADPPHAQVPLCAGLTIVTAISQPDGDYESIKTIESFNAGLVRLKYSNERSVPGRRGFPPSMRRGLARRAIREVDLKSANKYLQQFHSTPLEVPGTTAIGTSSAVLAALKAAGEAELILFDLPPSLPADPKLSANPNRHPSVFDHEVVFKHLRADPTSVTLPMTVNGVKVELPAIRATGTAEWGEKGEFFFLDDNANPLALKWQLQASGAESGAPDRDTLEVVKIAYRCSADERGTGRLERALSEARRVDVYDIYFSFNSDQIRDESAPTLDELGDVLRRHPDWKLSIDGHTDGVASAAFNLDLSKRRAAAVKAVLVTRYGIDAGRLTTAGFGKSRPQDTNDTPEGRARNRRVELVRE
jgi:outer membrane protein OmpA-like peptidoglycan-associated protein